MPSKRVRLEKTVDDRRKDPLNPDIPAADRTEALGMTAETKAIAEDERARRGVIRKNGLREAPGKKKTTLVGTRNSGDAREAPIAVKETEKALGLEEMGNRRPELTAARLG